MERELNVIVGNSVSKTSNRSSSTDKHVDKMKAGSPFQFGTLSSLILTISMTAMMIYLYLGNADRTSSAYLLVIVMGGSGSVRCYFKYRKLQFQQGREFIGDRD